MHSAIQRLINLQWVQCSWHISEKFKCLCGIVSLVAGPKLLKWKRLQFFSSLLNYEVWWLYLCIFLSRWGPACSSTKLHGLCWNLPVRQISSRSRNTGCVLAAAARRLISPPSGWIALPPREKENKVVSWLVLCYACFLYHFSHRLCCTFRGGSNSRNKITQCDYARAQWLPLPFPVHPRSLCIQDNLRV